MRFTPREIDAMSLWEFECCFHGFAESKGAKPKAEPMTDEQMAELGIEGF